MCFGGFEMIGLVAPREETPVDLGVQGLDAALHHFRKTGVVADLGHGDAFALEEFGGSTGGKEAITMRFNKGACEGHESGFITYGE